jgi:predicted enzyme related to lactoylglutathione lyase
MSERTSYEPGTPSWVELSGTPDVDAAEAFYRDLLGWEIPEQPNSAELGGYRRAQLNGRDAADAGGTVIVDAMDVMGMGKMAVFSDQAGAVIGVWQPGTLAGAEIVTRTAPSAGTSSAPATSPARSTSTAKSSAGRSRSRT